jgi:hypothetical protein
VGGIFVYCNADCILCADTPVLICRVAVEWAICLSVGGFHMVRCGGLR